MITILLKNKLNIPLAVTEQVHRPRLFDTLDTGLHRKLTLVSAPAGFGRTTLIAAWVKDRNTPTAWFSIDKEDNQSSRFWAYFIAALQTLDLGIDENLDDALRAPSPPPTKDLLSELINEVWDIQTHFVLVLDDVHLIENPEIQEEMLFLLDHTPPTMHWVLSTRADPPWPLARLRGSGEINEIRIDDLRFSMDETTQFVNSIMGLALTPEEIFALDKCTEGWIVGLQMAALSMQGREDKSAFIRAFTGSHRFVLDYLSEEVLDQQPGELSEFLYKTSILDRLNGSLCDAVLNRCDSQIALKQLEEKNIFLIPLDEDRRWYRYHPLFADLLQRNLSQEFPDQVKELHHLASRWFAKYGMLPEAVKHASMTEDIEFVAQLVEENALTVITVFSEHLPILAAWLNALPEDLLHSRPWLGVARAWLLAYSGELDSAEAVIQEIEKVILKPPAGSSQENLNKDHLTGYLAAIRGYWFFMKGNFSSAVAWMEKAISRLPQTDVPGRVFSAIVLGAATGMEGDLEGGIRVLSEGVRHRQGFPSPLLSITILSELAGLQILMGRLNQVVATCEEVLHLSNEYYRLTGFYPPNLGFAYARLSYVLREQNDLETAIHYAQEAVKISKTWEQKDSLATSYSYLALALQSAGKAEDAFQMMRNARQVSRGLSGYVDACTAAYEAKVHSLLGDQSFFLRWADESGLSIPDEIPFYQAREYTVFARALLAQGKLNECLAFVTRFLPVVENAGALWFEIELLILQALTLHALGELEKAMMPLERALSLAEPEKYTRIFVDEGIRIHGLLHCIAQRGLSSHYISNLLAILEAIPQPEDEMGFATAIQSTMNFRDVLTRREIEILRILMTPRSVSEIADALCIQVSTLRTHIRNIYEKLGVHSRMEAIETAREMGLQ